MNISADACVFLQICLQTTIVTGNALGGRRIGQAPRQAGWILRSEKGLHVLDSQPLSARTSANHPQIYPVQKLTPCVRLSSSYLSQSITLMASLPSNGIMNGILVTSPVTVISTSSPASSISSTADLSNLTIKSAIPSLS